MGLFDSIAKQAFGSMLGGTGGLSGLDFGALMNLVANPGKVSAAMSGVLDDSGGIDGLLAKFQTAGQGQAAASWVSPGANESVDGEQIRSALGSDTVQHFASKLGMQADQILPILAQFLPVIIDKLTPAGLVEDNQPTADKLQQVLSQVVQSVLGGKA